MAAAKFLVFSLFLALLLSAVWADSSTDIDGDVVEPAIQVTKSTDLQSSALKAELDQLKSKIQDLESQIDRKTKDLKEKEEKLAKKEKVIKEKTDSITSLQSEVSSLQKKGKLDSAEQLNKANAQVVDLEKQLDRLKAEFEAQNVEKETLENRASKAETKLDELNSKLKDVHGAWLPPWLAVQFAHFQSFAQKHWHAHGKPTMAIVTQKAQENKEKAAKWAQPHLEAVKTKWVPAVKGQWVVVTTQVQPHVRSLSAKTVEVYETSKTAITGHVIKIQDIVDPYFQEAKKFSQPYIEQVATVTKPHVDKIRVVVKPYTKEAVRAYGKFLESATTYHQQVQGTVQETLKKHELTKSLATKELIWFLASALLALPIFVLARVCSAVFGKKTKRTSRGTHSSSHSRRKGKRVHSEK
ncbi:hypothetical protein LINPERPRIM_LOCUS39140 [Linum perenne]